MFTTRGVWTANSQSESIHKKEKRTAISVAFKRIYHLGVSDSVQA